MERKSAKEGSIMPKTPLAATPKSRKTTTAKSPTHEEIALRAYHIFLERNGAPGNPFDDWARAERELLQQTPKQSKPRRKSNVTSIAA
jgi:Protein of unknown function (DUF2934)